MIEGSSIPDYPLAGAPLLPAWRNRVSLALATACVATMLVAITLRFPIAIAEIDDVALRIVFPAALGFILAFAPTPATSVGRIARGLTVIGLCAAVFAGDLMPMMLACYPLVLMLSVVIDLLLPARADAA